ncbi:MAG TPA: hypothetical protein VFS00_32250, partial [Polyangiaceae bacterium]|nr:hypothetical protein [Polyangiaceae bacterium]
GPRALDPRWVACLALAANACAAPGAPAAPRSPSGRGCAALYVDRTPTRAYREIGLVQALGEGLRASEADVLRALRREGQRLGCDAIVRVEVRAGETRAHALGVCVQWADAPPVAPPPRPPS